MQKIIIGVLSIILFTMLISIAVVGIDNNSKNKKAINNSVEEMYKDSNKIKAMYNKEDLEISVYITKKDKTDIMDIEEYVLGVVAAEMPAEFELEALKAQAVAARTYGLAHTESFGGQKSPKANGANLNDTVQFQAFMHKEERMDKWPKEKRKIYWEKLKRAVKETEGMVLTYNNELVMEPYYFSTSSGKTEDAVDVFSTRAPYLKSVESPGEERSSKYKSEFKYTYSELSDVLNKWDSNIDIDSITLKDKLTILERSDGGSVSNMKVGNKFISGQKFRSILNLSSANFSIKFNTDNVVITCSGYGHGVGMSQWGADAMAKEGANYEKILKHYYQGTEITKLKIR